MSRTVAVIDGEIAGVKAGNVDWMTNSGVMALITALTNEKNLLSECNNSDFMLLINIFLNFLMDFSFCEFILMIMFIYLFKFFKYMFNSSNLLMCLLAFLLHASKLN